MGMLGNITWIALYAVAVFLLVTKRGNLLIVFGLFGLGLGSFVVALANFGLLNYGLLDEFFQVNALIVVVAAILLAAGIASLTGVIGMKPRRAAQMQDAQGVNLATLFIPRNDTNTFSKAERLRDEACERFLERARRADLQVIEQRSQAHSPTVWFRLDYLSSAPAEDLSLAMSVAVDIDRFDFHRFEHTFKLTVQVGAQVTTISDIVALDDAAVERIHEYLMTPGKKLRLQNRVRQYPWQLWRPANKVQRLQRDWVTIGLTGLAAAVLVIPIAGILIAAGLIIFLYIRSRKRRTYVLTSGKPKTDPRSLRWMDSWQASIPGLGSVASEVQQGIMDRLRESGPEGASVGVEKIGYWGTDSWVEREQTVIIHRRAMGFVHVVAYGDTLFTAWESHLNSASWVEEKLSAGVDRESKLDVVANRVVAGWHQINEYDVSDSNFLGEWIHEATKREIRLRMAEHRIDQEIDFTVQRESRTTALSSSPAEKPSKQQEKKSRFRRVA